jgi:hypothetical protein
MSGQQLQRPDLTVVELPRPHRRHLVVDTACVLALIGLAGMTWSILDPRPIPVFIAMSVGQAIGTLSLLLFLIVLVLGASRSKTDRGTTP